MYGSLSSLTDKVGLGRRQEPVEVGDGLSLAAMGLRLDHGEQNIAAPAVGERLLHVPLPGWQVLHLL